MNRRQRILVIGGAGYMGGAITRRLREHGHEVGALIRNTSLVGVPDVPVYTGGLENVQLLDEILSTFDSVVHAASGTNPGSSAKAPSLEAELNLAPTLRFLEVLAKYPHLHLVYISSGGTVYGDPAHNLVTEDTPLQPRSFYGAGKAAIEIFLNSLKSQYRGRITVLRPSNLFGPGQPYYPGFGVVRTMLQHVRQGSAMSIWGDGTTVRDYLYIDDMVAACVLALERRDSIGTFNVGSGVGYSLNELKKVVELVSGRALVARYEPSRQIDVSRVVLDVSRIRDTLGWTPQVTLEDGVRRTWEWFNT